MEHNNEQLEALRNAMGDNNAQFINGEDTFDFQCQQCGQCCMHRTDIILNPFDIYNGSRYLGIEPSEFLMNYTEPTIGRNSKIPMITLKCDDRGYCPLLKLDIKDGCKFKCSINPAKPGACANHPIGVIMSFEKNTNKIDYEYVKVEQCENSKNHNQINKVSDWCKNYEANKNEIMIAHRMQTIVENYFPCRVFEGIMNMLIDSKRDGKDLEEFKKEATNDIIVKTYLVFNTKYLSLLYGNYDISKPFIPQAEENLKNIEENLLTPIKKLLVEICTEMPENIVETMKDVFGNNCLDFMNN